MKMRLKIVAKEFTREYNKKGKPSILMHKPHPRKELMDYQIKQLKEILEQEGLI